MIRVANKNDSDAIWAIFHKVVKTGDTYVFSPDMSKDDALAYWLAPTTSTFVAVMDGKIAGTFILKPNQPGLGSHVANASFMVHPGFQGKGLGKAMAAFALEEAKRQGYLAMQFNLVISTNVPAVKLWEKMGFKIVGTLPKVFQHKTLGLVDTYVMHKYL